MSRNRNVALFVGISLGLAIHRLQQLPRAKILIRPQSALLIFRPSRIL